MPTRGTDEPMVDVVIPVHNEGWDLRERTEDLRRALAAMDSACGIILVENGSTDDTWAIARELESRGLARALCLPIADYGAALRLGVRESEAPILVLAEIDFCDVEFIRRAVALLGSGADLVQSSKACEGAVDRRPWVRRAITRGFNAWLRASLGFRGTDTHGMKAARRQVLEGLLNESHLNGNLLATEMVIRADRKNLRVEELPVSVCETRPSAVGVMARVPSTLQDMRKLKRALNDADSAE